MPQIVFQYLQSTKWQPHILCSACAHLWINHVLLGWTATSGAVGDETVIIMLLKRSMYTKTSLKNIMQPCLGIR